MKKQNQKNDEAAPLTDALRTTKDNPGNIIKVSLKEAQIVYFDTMGWLIQDGKNKQLVPDWEVLPKVPADYFLGIISKMLVHTAYETCVLLIYNTETKSWSHLVPPQSCTAAHNTFISDEPTLPEVMFGSIHTHPSIGVFHSGTDTDDEDTHDGYHFVVDGGKDLTKLDITVNLTCGGAKVDVPLWQVLTAREVEVNIEEAKKEFEKRSPKTQYQHNSGWCGRNWLDNYSTPGQTRVFPGKKLFGGNSRSNSRWRSVGGKKH